MKNEIKEHKIKEYKIKKHKKNGHWIEILKGILHNCPYLAAMAATSLVVVICSDEIGIRAIAGKAETFVQQTIEMGVYAEELSLDTMVETTVNDVAEAEIVDENEFPQMENAGDDIQDNDKAEDRIEDNNDDIDGLNSENSKEFTQGVTNYEFYEPEITDSYYYSDAGKIALTTEYPYSKVDIRYFNDAVFIGDSRTLGISDYAGLGDADFYCDNGMSVLKLLDADGVTYQKTGRKEDLNQVLQQKHYGKIYIMLGMNDLGYGTTEMYLERYRNTVNQFREWQPDALIYIMANLHVSREKNNPETEFNNININDKNAASASLADGTDIFYLDANPLFIDSEGFLEEELSFDGVHLYAQNYDAWREFLLEHAVIPEDAEL